MPDERSTTLSDSWLHLSDRAKVRIVAVAVGALLIAAAAGVVIGRMTAPGTAARQLAVTPCDLFSPSLARDVLGGEVERFRLIETVPTTATSDQLRRVETVDEKTCAYVPAGAAPSVEKGAVFQLDRRLFESEEEFLEAHEGAEEVDGIGEAAMVARLGDDGWALSVLVKDTTSFALAVPVATDQEKVVDAGRRIADELSETETA